MRSPLPSESPVQFCECRVPRFVFVREIFTSVYEAAVSVHDDAQARQGLRALDRAIHDTLSGGQPLLDPV
jgi:hypothetical protein